MKKFNELQILLLFVTLLLAEGCDRPSENEKQMQDSDQYGITAEQDTVREVTLTNANGLEMTVISYGGIITSLKVPDKNGNIEDIVLGFDSLSSYEDDHPYFGALIGRYGNRIAKGKFTLEGQEYSLPQNNGPNSLHGGPKGFHKVNWQMEKLNDRNGVRLSYTSEDMEQGYPGNLDVEVTYVLTDDNELEINYNAETDKPTVVNLTQHTYFNLSGDMTQTILDHILMINADKYLPVDSTLIPTGELRSVENTPFDYTEPKKIGRDINAGDQQIEYGLGFDHSWVLNESDSSEMTLAATLYHKESGRFMEVLTTEPAVQFYSGNFLDGSLTGKEGVVYEHRTGLCLETQHFPDSPNQPDFPSTRLNPGDKYETTTIYKFSVK